MMVKSVAGVAWTAQSWPGGHGRAYQDTPAGRTIHNLRFSGSQLCPVSARRQGAARMSRTLTFHRVSETRCKGAAQRPGYVEESKAHTLSTSSLRAQRLVREALAKAEGESLRGGRLDCFAALAMTEHEAAAALFQLAFRLQTRLRILAARFARALLRHSTLKSKRAQGRPGAGWHPRSTARKAHAGRTAQQHTGVANHSAFPAR